jgi:holliday junction DNA helicase RuvA
VIASLRGEVLSIGLDHAVIECAGVGYQVLATPPTLGRLRRGEETLMLTSMVAVKDGVPNLYGFGSDEERRMFHLLQTLSGLGPKLAIACLTTLQPAEISKAVAEKDAKTLQTIPGVGKRMADRMVVELGGKVDEYLPAPDDAPELPIVPAHAVGVAEQVVEALVGLGFTDRVAGPVVDGILAENPDLDTAAALRSALSQLGRK